jgi:5-methylcytosine-specific restriction enzyme subunit McrC
VALEIRPKLPVSCLLFMLSYASDPAAWRDAPADLAEADSLVDAFAWLFVGVAGRAIRGGLLHGYAPVEATLMGVRGRVRWGDQVRGHLGRLPPLETSFDEFTADVDENRLLKAAARQLMRASHDGAVRNALRRLETAFEGVSPVIYDPRRIPSIPMNPANARYQTALTLARLALRASSTDISYGDVPAAALLVDVGQVFEEFVVAALRELLGLSERTFPRGDAWPAAGPRLPLDQAGEVQLRPEDRCVFVGDVKYKRVAASGVEHADLYQLLAYVVAAGLPGGLLIYAAGEAETVSHTVVHAGKELQVIALDLGVPPDQVLEQISTLAQRIRRLRQRARVTSTS